MASTTGTNNSETINISGWSAPVFPETAHSVNALGGNDTVYGSAYTDFLIGGAGNDTLYGNAGNDTLIGGSGNDVNFGGSGDDNIYSGAGNDELRGGTGNDTMWGATGDDDYFHFAGEGVDVINDDKNETGGTGAGGGDDTIYLGFNAADIVFYNISNSLYLLTAADAADGFIDDGVIIEDFFSGGNNVVETLKTADDYTFDLTGLLSVF